MLALQYYKIICYIFKHKKKEHIIFQFSIRNIQKKIINNLYTILKK